MYEKYPTICFASFSFCLIAYIFSPHTDIQIRTSEVSAYEIQTTSGKMATGLSVPIPDARKNDKPKEEYKESCNVECKTSLLKDLGIRDEIAESLVINCKALADNPVKCIKI